MAGDWIPMRCNLADDPDVIAIACRLKIDEDTAVGKLHRFWSWADQHTADGNAVGVTYSWIDRRVGIDGFSAALESRGWIEPAGDGIHIPNFERFLGKSGKKRAKTNQRVSEHREKKRKCNAASVTESVTREQKRTEEKRETPIGVSPPTPRRGAKGPKQPKFDPTKVSLPPSIDTLEFREAWLEWVEHRREIGKPVTERGAKLGIAKLERYGSAKAIEAIHEAIAAGWQGLFPSEPRAGPARPSGGKDLMDGHRKFASLLEHANGPEAVQQPDDGIGPVDRPRLLG